MSNYSPPKVANYPKDKEMFLALLSAYTQEQKPAELFFEFFIIDTIGDLPVETLNRIDEYFAERVTKFQKKGNGEKQS